MSQSISSKTYKHFREGLKARRLELNLSQAALAKKLGQPQQFVSRYELGERRLDVGEFIEIALQLKIDPVRMIRELLAQRKK